MPQGDKSAYTTKQKRKAEHIEEGYEKRGTPKAEAERRAWATVNKTDHGGKKSGSGRGRTTDKAPAKTGGAKGGAARKGATASRSSNSKSKGAKTVASRSRASSSRSK
jgi:plasmid stabilization system protein ParE